MTEIAKDPRRWFLLATVGMGVFLVCLDNTVLYTALPTIVAELDATAPQMLWIINAYPIVICGLLLGTGTLGDKVGHRRLFIIGLIIFGLASLLGGYSTNVATLIAARGLLAIGAATMMPATLALIRHTFEEPAEMNLAIGIWSALATLAAAFGPVVGGLLLEYFRWGSVFLMNVPIVLAALIALPFVSKRDEPKPDQAWDFRSVLQAMIVLVSFVLFIKQLAHRPVDWGVVAVALVVAVIFGFRFTKRQGRLDEALLDFGIFRSPPFLSGVFGAGLAMFAVAGFDFLTTQRLQLIDGFSPLHAGVYVTIVAIGSLISSLIASRLYNFHGARPFIAGGLGLGAVGAIIVAFGSNANSNAVILTGLGILGIGLGASMAVSSISMIGGAPPNRAGMASSVEEVSYELGALLSVAILGSAITLVYSVFYDVNAPALAGTHGAAGHEPHVSLQDAVQFAAGLPDGSVKATVLQHAHDSYLSAYTLTALIVVLVLAAGALYTNRLLRHREPGESEKV